MRCCWLPLLALSGVLPVAAASARDDKVEIDVDAGPLGIALSTLSAQSGVSVGIGGPMPTIAVEAVRGRMTGGVALARMLRGSKWRAVRVGPAAYRLEPHAAAAGSAAAPPPPDITVTARKLSEAASDVPGPLAVFVPATSHRAGVATDTHAVARSTDGLTLTNIGPGRDRPFLRGVADSPFNGFSQTTVSVQLDEGRVTYNAAEPGLRLVDVDRVEVLKGPQGPLYGTGALGGVYRIVVNRPVLNATSGSAGFGLTGVSHGGLGGQAEAVANVALLPDRAAVRLVTYASAQPGWIADAGRDDDLNQSLATGGRAALRVAPVDGWTIDLSGTAQDTSVRDSQYVDGDADELVRSLALREPRSGRVLIAQGSASGPVGGVLLTVATSQTWQDQDDIYDASGSAAAFGVAAPVAYRDRRSYQVFDQEVRWSSLPGQRLGWTAGGSYLVATTRATGTLSDPARSPVFALHRSIVEAAGFADGSLPLFARLTAELGVRVFRTTTDDELDTPADQRVSTRALVGVTPSGSLSYAIAPGTLAYLRFGTAFRPGGVDPTNAQTGRYDADEVSTVDLGGRFRRGDLAVEADAFRSSWRDIQSDYLQSDGLVATRNAGNAEIVGAELSFVWRPRAWRMSGGVAWQRARLTAGIDGRDLTDDVRLPVAPDIAGRIEVQRRFSWGRWRIAPYAAGNLVGAARLSFDPGLDRRIPGYATGRVGVEIDRGNLAVRVGIENVFDARADTFAFGNPFSIRKVRQYTPLQPRTLTIGLSRDF